MFGRGGRGGGGGGGRQVCHFFLEGRCRFGGMLTPIYSESSQRQMLTRQQITARTSILQDRAIHNLKADLAATDLLHLVITTTKAAQGIDQALLAQVRSLLLPYFLLWSVVLQRSNATFFQLVSTSSLQLHFNILAHESRHHALPLLRHCSSSTHIAPKPIIATMSRLRLNMNSTNRHSGTPNQDTNP